MNNKSTLQEIQERFDLDVARFANLETGQATTIDATFNMELVTEAIAAHYPALTHVLDIGCGAGNYDVKLLADYNSLAITLVDLSLPMLTKAKERIDEINEHGQVTIVQGDFRTVSIPTASFEVIIATAVLHHLRDDADWEVSFKRLYDLLKPGGSIWIFDLIQQSNTVMQELVFTKKYGAFLSNLKDDTYRDHVFDYIDKEDSPRPLMYQLDLLRKVGFSTVDILHKNLCFASFVGFK